MSVKAYSKGELFILVEQLKEEIAKLKMQLNNSGTALDNAHLRIVELEENLSQKKP